MGSRLFVRDVLKSGQKGFSLIELSVVISIAAASIIGFLSWTQPETISDARHAIETRKKIDTIEKAIQAFRVEKDRLPCPADPYMRIDNSFNDRGGTLTDDYVNDFGSEDLDETQTVVNSVTSLGIDCPVSVGAVPVQSLGLGSDYINDAWGRRFTYSVSPNLCGEDAGTGTLSNQDSQKIGCTPFSYENNVGNITISNGARTLTSSAAYAIVSHGANGLGAFLPSAEELTDSVDANELENTDTDLTFVKMARNAATGYDDITSYKTKIQLERLTTRTNARQITVTECETNSQLLKTIDLSEADFMELDISNYDHLTGLYNTGEQVGLGIMMGFQNICVSYYGHMPAVIRGQTWSGAQCPGNNDPATNGTTYSSKNSVCTCDDKLWDGGCGMDWFAAGDLEVEENIVLWLDADTPETIFDDSSCNTLADIDDATTGGVGCWADKSGNGRNATIGTSNEPDYVSNGINELDSIDFTPGNSDYFNLPNLSYLTGGEAEIFAVLNKNTGTVTSTNDGLWRFGTDAAITRFPWTNNQIYDEFGSDDRVDGIVFNQDLTGNVMYNVMSAANEWVNRINGIEIRRDITNDVDFRTAPTLGRSSNAAYFNGKMGEVILYDTKLTYSNRQLIEKYLGDKWDISVIPISSSSEKLTVPNPVLWLDADEKDTIYADSTCTTKLTSGTVGCWADKSQKTSSDPAYAYNAVQSSSTNYEPTYVKEVGMNYKSVLSFSSNDYLVVNNNIASTFNGDFSLFLVGDFTAPSSDVSILAINDYGTGNSDVLNFAYNSSTFKVISENITPNDNDIVTDFNISDPPFIFSVTSSDAAVGDLLLYYNGVKEVDSLDYEYELNMTADRMVIGADYDNTTLGDEFDGFIGEIIVYPSELEETDRKAVELYLSDKWGIEVDH